MTIAHKNIYRTVITQEYLKDLYNNLSNNNVTSNKYFHSITYEFGCYLMHYEDDQGVQWISIGQRINGSVSWIFGDWDSRQNSQEHPFYKLYIAVKNKVEGKEFFNPYNPYKNKTGDVMAKESSELLGRTLTDNAYNFFPSGYVQDLQKLNKIITETKNFFEQKLRENYRQ